MEGAKGGMDFEDAKQRRGSKLVYLREPWLNLIVADKYKEDTSYAWIEIAKFYATLTAQKKAKKVAIQQDGDTYYWMSFNLIISRLWHYGIRSKSTVSRALHLLCNPTSKSPPLLKRIQKRDSNGHIRLYYAKTDTFDDLFDTDPEWAEDNEFEYKSSDEDDVFDDEESPSGEIPHAEEKPVELFTFPDWWDHFWEEVSATGKYTDKIYKDKYPTVVNGYVQDAVKAISSILEGVYYDKGFYGEFHDVKYDLSAVTIDSIIDAMKKYNVKEAVTMKEVVCPFAGKGKNSRKSRFISLVCVGTEWPKDNVPVKPKSFYEADKPDKSPDWIWEPHQLPSLYPEIQQDDRKFWGFYVTAMEYIDDCQKNKGTDRTKWGLWAKLNNGLTNPANNIFMDIFRSAKEAGMPLDEVYSLHMGDVDNFLWILTARRVKHSHGIKILPDGATKDNNYIYEHGPLNRAVYEKKGAKR